MVARSIPLWKENEQRWGTQLLHQHGALWIAAANDAYEKASIENIRRVGLPHEVVPASDGRRRFPQINWDGLRWAILETAAGFVLARRACQAVVEGFVAENGTYRQADVAGGDVTGGLRLRDGSRLVADQYVFACGPWLAQLFPDVLRGVLTPTRQETFYFGTPAGDRAWTEERLPTWVDNSPVRFYGIPGNQWRGFKIAKDAPGDRFDPTAGDRLVSPEGLAEVRRYLAFRFPALRDAPLVESRVCQYEMSADGGLIVDRHPQARNVWIVGGGSGHGFKFGPALGEQVAKAALEKMEPDARFNLGRFTPGSTGRIGERK
jgi:glycine/D-amino acid oxidase-like deaminating enzyme